MIPVNLGIGRLVGIYEQDALGDVGSHLKGLQSSIISQISGSSVSLLIPI